MKKRFCSNSSVARDFHIGLNRALVSLGQYSEKKHCPYSCRFCYVPAGFSHHRRVPIDRIVSTLAARRHREPFESVYVSGDTDSFAPGRDGVGLLEALTLLEVDLLFTTRSELTSRDIQRIEKIVHKQQETKHVVAACMSIPRLHSCSYLEPEPIPSPHRRMETLRLLQRIGCVSILTLRPFLPVIPVEEYLQTIDRCSEFIECVLGDYWYVDESGFLESLVLGAGNRLPDDECDKKTMDFNENTMTWKAWRGDRIYTAVKEHCEKLNIPFFMRSQPALEFIRKHPK